MDVVGAGLVVAVGNALVGTLDAVLVGALWQPARARVARAINAIADKLRAECARFTL